MIPPKTFAIEKDLGYRNLVVSGCSFTHNFDNNHIHTWPYYLRDLGGFQQVYNLSCPGAGNNHIHRSVISCIDSNDLSSTDTLIVIMWSGYDRDDFLISSQYCEASDQLNSYSYNKDVMLGMTGGFLGHSNMLISLENVKKIKSAASIALENYIAIRSTQTYLEAKRFKYMFCEFSTPGAMRDTNFDPVPYLPTALQKIFVDSVRSLTPNLGDWSIPILDGDGYHPNADQHLSWTSQVLLPALDRLISSCQESSGPCTGNGQS
jgi:hypothetical protein